MRFSINMHGVVAALAIAVSILYFWPSTKEDEPLAGYVILSGIAYGIIMLAVNRNPHPPDEGTVAGASLSRLQVTYGGHLFFAIALLLTLRYPRPGEEVGVYFMIALAIGMTMPFLLLRRVP